MPTTTLAPQRPRSDVAAGDLVLRIIGSPHNGQIVRLRSPKCTIGSGGNCTLRLQASGVAAVQCLILRSRTAAIVRCWSADTRLNQQPFTDAPLSPGDRLGIGSIELEVLSIGVNAPSAAQEPAVEPAADSAWEPQTEQPSARQAEWETERNALAAERTALTDERNALAEQRRQWQAEQEEAQRRWNEERQQFDAQKAEWEANRNVLAGDQNALADERNALTEQRRQWQTEQEEAQHRWNDERQQFDAQRAEWEANRNVLAGDQNALADERNALTEQRRQWQAEQEAAQRRWNEERQQFDAQKAEWKANRNVLAGDQNALADERNALTEQRRQWQAEQEAAQRRWNEERQQFAAQKAQWEAEQNTTATDRTALVDERNALAEQRRQWQAEQEEAQRRWNEERQQFAARQAELETERKALATERQQWEQRRAEAATRVEPLLKTSETGTEAELSGTPTEHELQFEEPVQHAPVDLADVLRRVGAKIDSPEEETDQTALPAGAVEQAASPVSEQHPHSGEESIDDYMSRLMQRVRVSAGEPPATGAAAESPKPSAAVSSSASNVKPSEPVSAPPRAVAAEKRTDLSALRELANLAAHSAISHHAHRVLKNHMYSKALIASVALVMGGGLLWMWNQHGAWQMALYAAVVAFLVGAYWGVEYAFLTRRIRAHRPRPANEGTAETTSGPEEQTSDKG